MIVDSGGREHILAGELSQSSIVDHVYVVPSNAEMSGMGNAVSTMNDVEGQGCLSLVALIKESDIGLAVTGPDSAIVKDVRDYFNESKSNIVFRNHD
jgi:phosphoribosylamine--glycine ligase